MLTSDFGNYSEITTDSLTSDSSEYLSSEVDNYSNNNKTINDNNKNNDNDSNYNGIKKKSKTKPRSQKKVKYWTLPTMSNGTFNPSMLTARQQLQYLSQKSKLGEESDSLELSPLRLDRIKFEEMKSLNSDLKNSHESTTPNQKEQNSPRSLNAISSPSPNHRQQMSHPTRGSKLKEEIASSPTNKSKRTENNLKTESLNDLNNEATNLDQSDSLTNLTQSDNLTNLNQSDYLTSTITQDPAKPSFFGTVKGLIFDYNETRRNHFETFLKDFAKRLGLPPSDEIVKAKREEIIKKGMI